MDYMEAERHERCPVCPKEQTHVHEVLGSVWIAEAATDPHNHRFAVVTCDVIPVGTRDHVHEVKFRTDFYEDIFMNSREERRARFPLEMAGTSISWTPLQSKTKDTGINSGLLP